MYESISRADLLSKPNDGLNYAINKVQQNL